MGPTIKTSHILQLSQLFLYSNSENAILDKNLIVDRQQILHNLIC